VGHFGSHHGVDHDVNRGHHHHHHQHGHNGNGGQGGGGGQVTTGSISGSVVNDMNGTGISGVTVTLTNDTTGAALTAVTDVNGNFSFAGLQPGSYTLSETAAVGFQLQTSSAAGSLGGTTGLGAISGIVVAVGSVGTGSTLQETPFTIIPV
jgi:hypothetical protein